LNDKTVKIISTAGGHTNQGCKIKIEAFVDRDSKFPQEGSGCSIPKPIKLRIDSATIKLGMAKVAEIIT
jgi:hypothetical protein